VASGSRVQLAAPAKTNLFSPESLTRLPLRGSWATPSKKILSPSPIGRTFPVRAYCRVVPRLMFCRFKATRRSRTKNGFLALAGPHPRPFSQKGEGRTLIVLPRSLPTSEALFQHIQSLSRDVLVNIQGRE